MSRGRFLEETEREREREREGGRERERDRQKIVDDRSSRHTRGVLPCDYELVFPIAMPMRGRGQEGGGK